MNTTTLAGFSRRLGSLLLTAAIVGWVVSDSTAQEVIDEGAYLTASDGLWQINYSSTPGFDDGESFFPPFGGLDSWYSTGEVWRSHLFQQSWYFRTDGDSQEYPIESLTLMGASNTNPATGNFEEDKILLEFGDPSFDPFGVTLFYDLDETAPDGLGSAIRESITLTSFSGPNLGVTLFAYTDLDLDNSPIWDTGTLFSANTIRQTSMVGSQVDVRVTSGPNPNAFDIAPYDNIVFDLDDGLPTELTNNPQFGPGDVTHAFQWNLTLGSTPLTIGLEKDGSFVDIVLPDDEGPGGFVFNEDNPPPVGADPRWYDPIVAVGYDYEVTAGDNAFAEVYLPVGFDDSQYTLLILDPEHDLYNQEVAVVGHGQAMAAFDFVAADAQGDGVSLFRLMGIEPSAFVDPYDPLGFPTGFTYVNGNALSLSQTAITIPEPVSLGWLAWMGVLAGGRRLWVRG